MSHDFRDSAYGLTTEQQFHVNRMLQDYSNGKLSLRRIAESDPAFKFGAKLNPPKVFGVWEDGVAPGEPNWVFTLAEMSIDHRVLARIMENDMKRMGADERIAKRMALGRAAEASKLKHQAEEMEARREEMVSLGKIMDKKSVVTHTIGGVKYRIGARLEPVKGKHIN